MNVKDCHITTVFCTSFLFILCVSLLLSSFVVGAPLRSQTMTLLAVSEGGPANESTGSTATVTLEIVPGSGRIFIDTFPFSKIDTQVSVRLANEVACHFLATDCSQYDFIYSIKTGGSAIGGPSAGAAISALTVASLDGQIINVNTTMSGTINSGGIVGAVGGLKAKIAAAAKQGLKLVIIPLGERYVSSREELTADDNTSDVIDITTNNNTTSNSNSTISTNNSTQSIQKIALTLPAKTDLIAYGRDLGITVVEIGTLDEVLSLITQKQYVLPNVTISPPLYYKTQMKHVAQELCGRAQTLLNTLSVNIHVGNLNIHIDNNTQIPNDKEIILNNSNIDLVSTLNSARELLNTSHGVMDAGSYYSAASYCYGAALNLRFISLLNGTSQDAAEQANQMFNSTDINLSQYRTITDLQTYMLVDERLTEAAERISDGQKFMTRNLSVLAINSYATAMERIYSAKLWSSFFSTADDKTALDLTQVADSCKLKIQEATERQSLIGYYIDDQDVGADLLMQAQKQLNTNPVLCLFAASKAKASYDVVLSTLGLTTDVFNATFDKKSQIAARVMSEQFTRGAFPIIGYSYYEYARSLATTDQSAALLYIQFALELSNLDAYLPPTQLTKDEKAAQEFSSVINLPPIAVFVVGIALGLLLGVTIIKVEQLIKNRISRRRVLAISKKKSKK